LFLAPAFQSGRFHAEISSEASPQTAELRFTANYVGFAPLRGEKLLMALVMRPSSRPSTP